MVEEYLFGQMGGDMKVNTLTIKNKDMESSDGLTDVVIKGDGKTVGKMDVELILINKAKKRKELGSMARKFGGMTDFIIIIYNCNIISINKLSFPFLSFFIIPILALILSI